MLYDATVVYLSGRYFVNQLAWVRLRPRFPLTFEDQFILEIAPQPFQSTRYPNLSPIFSDFKLSTSSPYLCAFYPDWSCSLIRRSFGLSLCDLARGVGDEIVPVGYDTFVGIVWTLVKMSNFLFFIFFFFLQGLKTAFSCVGRYIEFGLFGASGRWDSLG